MYFKEFPKFLYNFKVNGKDKAVIVKDITQNVRIRKEILANVTLYDEYDIKDGETPEYIASEFYGDPLLHWIVLLANNITDRYEDWPMSVAQFEDYVHGKYSNVNATHHYEFSQTSGDTTKVIEIPNDAANTIPVGAVTITNYEYEELLQEQKRKIRLVKPEFVGQIKQELKSRLRGN